jgi:hypothetical protein
MQRDTTDTLDHIALTSGIVAKLLKLNSIDWQILFGLCHESHLYYVEYLISSNKMNIVILLLTSQI